MSADVDRLVEGIGPTREGILKLAGTIQAKGVEAEASGASGVTFAHKDTAYLVRTLQTIAGLLGELTELIEHQNHELQIRDSLPSMPKPLLMQ